MFAIVRWHVNGVVWEIRREWSKSCIYVTNFVRHDKMKITALQPCAARQRDFSYNRNQSLGIDSSCESPAWHLLSVKDSSTCFMKELRSQNCGKPPQRLTFHL